MLEKRGNILNEVCDAVCVTTNGFVKKNGRSVMGRGCAKQFLNLYPDLDLEVAKTGNIVKVIGTHLSADIINFPVKPVAAVCSSHDDYVSHMNFNIGQLIPGWACKASMTIIKKSAYSLKLLADTKGYKKVVLPRPGCGAGELSWTDVKVVLSMLDNRFVCMTF